MHIHEIEEMEAAASGYGMDEWRAVMRLEHDDSEAAWADMHEDGELNYYDELAAQ